MKFPSLCNFLTRLRLLSMTKSHLFAESKWRIGKRRAKWSWAAGFEISEGFSSGWQLGQRAQPSEQQQQVSGVPPKPSYRGVCCGAMRVCVVWVRLGLQGMRPHGRLSLLEEEKPSWMHIKPSKQPCCQLKKKKKQPFYMDVTISFQLPGFVLAPYFHFILRLKISATITAPAGGCRHRAAPSERLSPLARCSGRPCSPCLHAPKRCVKHINAGSA